VISTADSRLRRKANAVQPAPSAATTSPRAPSSPGNEFPGYLRPSFGRRAHPGLRPGGTDEDSAEVHFRAALALATVAAAGSWLLAGQARAGTPPEWVEYVDESATRISAAASLGVSDTEEKDLVSGDVDKDGDADLIIVRKLPFTNAGPRRNVLFMNEDGVMVDRTDTLVPDFLDATDDREVLLVDVDGDTWLDVVTAGTFDEQPRVLMNRRRMAGVWQGFVYEPARLPTITPGPKFCGLGAGDVTGNGRPDLYFTDYENTTEDRLLINDGNGFFTDETATRMPASFAASVFGTDAEIVDVNGDTFNDIVKNNSSGNSPPPGTDPVVSVLYNDGTGNFDFKDDIYTFAPYMTEAADFNKDGLLDFFVVDDNQDRFMVNLGNDPDGHAQFDIQAVGNSPNTIGFGGNVKFADLDGDTILDVLVADVDTDIGGPVPVGCSRELALLRGQGQLPNITYADPIVGGSRPWLMNGVYDVEPMHIDDDGVLDLWIGSCSGNRVFMGSTQVIFFDGFESGDTSAW
jgi:hypothetical protein